MESELERLPRFADRPGLERMARLVEPLRRSAWWRGLDAVKVTGSTGKGSVATMVASILRAAGPAPGRSGPVGLTVSPHVVDFAERFQLDGENASAEAIDEALAWLRPYLRDQPRTRFEAPLRFEALVALALRVFERADARAVVAEAGIGGRHDATRVLPGSVTALVSVDLEHTKLLGSTRREIAEDKADLADEGSTLVLGPLAPELVAHLRSYSARRDVEIVAFDEIEPLPPDVASSVETRLPGDYQVSNATLAAEAARRHLRRRSLDSARVDEAIRRGLETVCLPGRFERVRDDPPVFLDIAHTPDAVRGVAETARRHVDRPILLVLGVSADKDPSILAPPLLAIPEHAIVERVIATRAAERGGPVEPLLRLAREAGRPARAVEPVERAVEEAIAEARRDGLAVLVAGGLFLAREARRVAIE